MSAEQIETIYELTPMQQGMLFHSASAPEAGMYVEQVSCRLHGDLDVAAFARAWQHVVSRHAILRTAFYWENLEKPLQVVYRAADLPLEQQDWRDLSPEEQAARLSAYLAANRRQGFDLSQPPLLRLLLARLDAVSYQLVWSHHHILLDGWSLPLLLNEVLVCYEAFRQDRAVQLEQPRPFSDYIVWLQNQDQSQAEQFWRQTLQGFTTPSILAYDRSLPVHSQAAPQFADVRMTLSAQATGALHAFARQHGLTINTLVQGAWALLLSQYTTASDVLFGTTVAGRPADLTGVESMIGLFINTQPVRVQVPPTMQVLPWLQQVQSQQAALWRYQHTPLVEIQRWSELPPGQPLFESILVFENYPLSDVTRRSEGSVQIAEVCSYEQTNYSLTVVAVPGAELGLQISYDCRRFSTDQATRYLEHLRLLLSALIAYPAQRLADLPTLTPAEQQLVTAWNATAVSRPEICIHQLFEAQVTRVPDAIALTYGDEQLTYRELNERANQLAWHLRVRGVGPETRVAICLRRSPEMIVALLGILKAGGAYVPLDLVHPQERLQYMLNDSQATVLVTHQPVEERLPVHSASVIRFDADSAAISRERKDNPTSGVWPDHLAYIIYTSGSTGQPKGVLVPHRGVCNLAQAQIPAFGLTSDNRVLQFASFSFDASVWEVCLALLVGGTLCLGARDALAPGPAALEVLKEQPITTALLPPSVLAVLTPSDFPALHTVIAGGEACSANLAARWQVPGSGRRFFNAYGPTEITVCATIAEYQSGHPTLPIGTPIANTQTYILNEQLQHVPVGAAGELYIGGVGVARGYLNQPALTAERFVPDLWSAQPGGRLYRTGDLVRYHSDGNIEFLGRIDSQVKLRGFRIELGEIEATLAQHSAVQQSVVVVQPDRSGERRLVAYVVENREQQIREQGITPLASAELRQFLQHYLPDYMVPSAFVVLDALPLTAHGKVDQRALPVPDCSDLPAADERPRTQIAEILVGLWADVLGREQVGLHDNFFELGGHSLLATRVVSHVRSAFHVELSLLSIFESPTIAELSRQIEQSLQAQHALMLPPIRPAHVDRAPLSFTQERLWSMVRHDPGNPAFNISVALRLSGRFDRHALERSLNTIIQRHAVLRTTIVEDDEGLAQVISPMLALSLPVVDLGDLPPSEQAAEIQRATEDAARHRFDLLHGPLIHGLVLCLDDAEHALLLTIHHIVADGWSMGVLARELGALYTSFVADGESIAREREATLLPPLPIQYADYAIWQRDWLTGAVLDQQRAYWQQQLGGVPITALPTHYPRPSARTFQGAQLHLQLPAALSAQLRSFSRQESGTLFMTLLAAFNLVLWRMTGQADIVVGSPVAGRVHTETEHLIGLFLNMLPLRTRLLAEQTFQELLAEVRETTLAAYTHQHMPLNLILDAIQIPRDPRFTPLFQVVFNMLNVPEIQLDLPGLTITGLPPGNAGSKVDFTLYTYEANQAIQFELVYNTDLFTSERMERLLAQLQAVLTVIVAQPELSLAQLAEAADL
jgi:amino acid adenylation domain-containing protein